MLCICYCKLLINLDNQLRQDRRYSLYISVHFLDTNCIGYVAENAHAEAIDES